MRRTEFPVLRDSASEVSSLAASDPQIAAFVASVPVSRLWVCDLSQTEPITRERLSIEAFGGSCVVSEAELAALNAALKTLGKVDRIIEAAHDGEVHQLHIRIVPVEGDGQRRALVAVRDVTTERRLEEALQQSTSVLRALNGAAVTTEQALHLALADPLTALPNRRAFNGALESACAAGGFALCLTDMDRFKAVNDSLGHVLGDRLLKAVARRLRHNVRGDDFVARLAGDEFAIILKNVASEEAAREAASRILAAFEARLDLGELDLHAGLTAGVALAGAGDDASAVYRKADLALHAAKLRRRGSLTVHAFEQESLAAHEDLVAVKALLSGRLIALRLDAAVARSGETVAQVLRFGAPDAPEPLAGLCASAAAFGLAGDVVSTLLAQAFAAVADAWTGHPVHLRLPDEAVVVDDLAERILDRLAGAGLEPEAIALEVPLAALRTGAGAAAATRLRAAGVPLILADWDMSLAAFRHTAEGAFGAVKVDADAIEPLLCARTTADVCREAFHSLATMGVTVFAGRVGSDALARRLFALGVTAADGPAFAARSLDLRQPLTSAA
jgi:diguanylate cyclase (GGDEF)-like protein